ncbi:hypothetical protein HK096_000757, partial [Nowakowskiella sp. JEL0078]
SEILRILIHVVPTLTVPIAALSILQAISDIGIEFYKTEKNLPLPWGEKELFSLKTIIQGERGATVW